MSKVSVELSRTDVKTFGNYFLVIMLEQLTFPDNLVITEKFRTEVQSETEFPVFLKNYFEFRKIEMGNRISLKIALYLTQAIENFKGTAKQLVDLSKLVGAVSYSFTVEFIESLRKHKFVEISLRLFHPEKNKLETGCISLILKYKPETIDAMIYETNKEVESCYYDPFEKNREVVREKLIDAISLNEDRQIEMEKLFKKLDESNSELKKAAVDLNQCNIELGRLERDNEIMRKNLNKLESVDEIHIEVDLLSQSIHGIEILKKRYATLCSQLALQTEQTMNLENDYKLIDPIMSKIRLVKERKEFVEEANKELKFNIKREEDLVPLVAKYIEKTRLNDKIHKNLLNSISELNKLNGMNVEETEKRINELYRERRKIEEKTIQMNLHSELFSGDDRAWEDNFVKLLGNDLMMNNMYNERERYWIDQFRKKKLELEDIVKELSTRLVGIQQDNDMKLQKTIVVDPGLRKRKVELVNKIELAERREQVLMNEIDTSIMYHKSTISKLKDKIEEADKFIDKEVAFAKRNYYKSNNYGKY